MKRTVKKEVLKKWKLPTMHCFKQRLACLLQILKNKPWTVFLFISIHFQNCHCIVHKHLKQENFENAKSDLWSCGYNSNSINCITTKHISKNIYHKNLRKVMKFQLFTAMHSRIIHKIYLGGGEGADSLGLDGFTKCHVVHFKFSGSFFVWRD